MEPGSATLCFRRACSSSWRGGRSHFPKTTKSMSLDKRKVTVNHCSPHYAVMQACGLDRCPSAHAWPSCRGQTHPVKPSPPGERKRSSRSVCDTRMGSRRAEEPPGLPRQLGTEVNGPGPWGFRVLASVLPTLGQDSLADPGLPNTSHLFYSPQPRPLQILRLQPR